jgi:hypothetical protein
MPIIAKDGGSFTPHAEGQFPAVCVDVVDKGIVETTWQGKTKSRHVVRVVFQTDETLESGKPAIASRTFTLSLGEKSALRPFLESWRGRKFSAEELAGFDVESLIGAGAIIQVLHEKKGDKTYDNIVSAMKLMKGMQKLTPRDYVRVCDRPEQTAQSNGETDSYGPGMDDVPPPEDDDLPF